MKLFQQTNTPFSGIREQTQVPINKWKLAHSLTGNFDKICRLRFNRDGDILGAGCVDGRVSIWYLQQPQISNCVYRTGHISDVIALTFLENNHIVTGGKDSMIEHHRFDIGNTAPSTLLRLYCHNSAVTYLEPDPSSPHVLLSSSIDGTIRQFDQRIRDWGCRRSTQTGPNLGAMYQSPNCLIASHSKAEKFHSIRLHPQASHYMVVASSDAVVKLYDRRMLSMMTPEAPFRKPDTWITGYCPIHLLYQQHPTFATYAEFSPCGKSILTSYHSDHQYLFPMYETASSSSSPSSVTPSSLSDNTPPSSSFSSNHSYEAAAASAIARTLNTLPDYQYDAYSAATNSWRQKMIMFDHCLASKIDLANEYAKDGSTAGYLHLYNTCDNLYKASISFIQASLSHLQSLQANPLSTNPIYQEKLEIYRLQEHGLKELLSKTLLNRVKCYESRNFSGDKEAALFDLDVILQLTPDDVEALVMKAKLLLTLNFIYESAVAIDQLIQLTHYYDPITSDFLILQHEISELKQELDLQLREYECRNRHRKRKTRETNNSSERSFQDDDEDHQQRQQQYHPQHTRYRQQQLQRQRQQQQQQIFMIQDENERDHIRVNEAQPYFSDTRNMICSLSSTAEELLISIEANHFHPQFAREVTMEEHRMPLPLPSSSSTSTSTTAALITSTTAISPPPDYPITTFPTHHQTRNNIPFPLQNLKPFQSNVNRGVAQVHWKYLFPEGDVVVTKDVITRYQQRYVGASNIATLLLEACFLGDRGEYIVSGSDDGNVFFWDRFSGELIYCRHADPESVLSVQVRFSIFIPDVII
jgi:WD40 repeat protein